MDRRLNVKLSGRNVGALLLKDNGNLQFRYDSAYDGPSLSVALPVREEAYPHRECQAWFGGLLPEGDVKESLARALGTSSSNQFRILNEIGGDCAGAVEIVPEGLVDLRGDDEPWTLSPEDLDRVIRSLPRRPLGADPEAGIRMSLAGAQPKLPAIFEPTQIGGSGFALPRGAGPPTTHLVKPEPERFPGLVDNEFFCMTLARNIGLDVALTDASMTVSGLNYLLVRRYDRRHNDGIVTRIHQEDFCQALLVRSEDKYQQDGGPSFQSVADLIRRESSRPIEDLFRLWDAAVFNWAIGNCDAHAKNFSLLHEGRSPRLAPFYDLVSTAIYPELSTRWAMTIGGVRHDEGVSSDAWERLAREMNLAPRATLDRARELMAHVRQQCKAMLSIERFQNESAQLIAERIRGLDL